MKKEIVLYSIIVFLTSIILLFLLLTSDAFYYEWKLKRAMQKYNIEGFTRDSEIKKTRDGCTERLDLTTSYQRGRFVHCWVESYYQSKFRRSTGIVATYSWTCDTLFPPVEISAIYTFEDKLFYLALKDTLFDKRYVFSVSQSPPPLVEFLPHYTERWIDYSEFLELKKKWEQGIKVWEQTKQTDE